MRTYVEAFGVDQLIHDVSVRPLNDRQVDLLARLRADALEGAEHTDLF